MQKELQIIVAGSANSGKSNMMYYLQQLLMKEGFTVEMSFEGRDFVNENDFQEKMRINLDERQRLLKDMTKITLCEKQLQREAHQNINPKVKD